MPSGTRAGDARFAGWRLKEWREGITKESPNRLVKGRCRGGLRLGSSVYVALGGKADPASGL